MVCDLEAARITSLPADAFYISDFISEDEEERLLQKVASAPLPRWKQLSHRRLQSWPSSLTKSNTLIASPLPTWLTSPIIEPRFKKLGIFNDAPHAAPNHVLINEYRPSQGIMPHEDGAAYYPLVATVSLGAPIVLDLYEKDDLVHETRDERSEADAETTVDDDRAVVDRLSRIPKFRLLQERRSLLITSGSIYTDYLHGIAETTKDENLHAESICNWHLLRETDSYRAGWYQRETRTSLTYRDVLKVAKMGNSLRFLGRR